MSGEDVEALLSELSQCNTAIKLDDGLWMRAHASRDALPRRRRQHSSSSKRTSASNDARQRHG